MDDEDFTVPKSAEWPPKELDNMSVAALEHYGRQLEEELARVKRAIEAKQDYLGEADAMFRK